MPESFSEDRGFRFNDGTLVIDDAYDTITEISCHGAFQTGQETTTKFVAHENGVTPIEVTHILIDPFSGAKLIVDVSRYDYKANGDLVLFSYSGNRQGKFEKQFGKDKGSQVTIIGAKADLVYDDAAKKIKLTNFRP